MDVYATKIQHLIDTIKSQFRARTETEGRKHNANYGIFLDTTIDNNNVLWLSFTKGDELLCAGFFQNYFA